MQIYNFKDFNGIKARCGLRFISDNSQPDHIYVVLTELGDNPGASITNAYEIIAVTAHP